MDIELIYRTPVFVQMTIKLRDNVDYFKIYQSTNNVLYTYMMDVLNNTPNDLVNKRRFLGRCVFQFNPNDVAWNNDVTNYITFAPVVGGVEGAQEGPKIIPPLHADQHDLVSYNRVSLHAWNDVFKRYVPLQADDDFKLKTI